jgi:hypothetical protein
VEKILLSFPQGQGICFVCRMWTKILMSSPCKQPRLSQLVHILYCNQRRAWMDHNYREVPCGKFVPRNGHARTVTYKAHCPISDAVPHKQGRECQDKGMLFCKLYCPSLTAGLRLATRELWATERAYIDKTGPTSTPILIGQFTDERNWRGEP